MINVCFENLLRPTLSKSHLKYICDDADKFDLFDLPLT